jgi:hypothetical protein
MSRSTSLMLATAFAATLACTQAGAASYEGTAHLGKLTFEVIDLTPGDTTVPNYSFNTGTSSFVGSLTDISIVSQTTGVGTGAPVFVQSTTNGAPFDTTQPLRSVTANGQTASVEVSMDAVTAKVLTGAVSGYFGYAEGNIAAVTLANGFPALAQNTLLLAAHTQVTIWAHGLVSANLADGTVCPGCDAQFTGYAALIGGDQFGAYIAANQLDNNLRDAALTAAGISFVGLSEAHLNDGNPSASADRMLSLTFTNDTDSEQGYGFLAGAWINGNSTPSTTTPTTPVPEPETAGLALVGLLISGIALRRRQRA